MTEMKINPTPYRMTTDPEWVAEGYDAAVLYCPFGKDYEVCQCHDEDTAQEISDALNVAEPAKETKRRADRAAVEQEAPETMRSEDGQNQG